MTTPYRNTIIGRLDYLIGENFYTYLNAGCDDCHLIDGDHEDWCAIGKVVALLDRLEKESK